IVRSPVGAVLRAIRDNPLRATALGHNIHGYKLTAFVVASAYAGFAGRLLGPAVWLYLSDFLQTTLHIGATWKLVLGVVFVLLVCFLRRGLIGGIEDLYAFLTGARKTAEPIDEGSVADVTAEDEQRAAEAALAHQRQVAAMPARRRETD